MKTDTKLEIPAGWYVLEEGTPIQEGDRFYCPGLGKWCESYDWEYGFQVAHNDLTYIRRIPERTDTIPTPPPGYELLSWELFADQDGNTVWEAFSVLNDEGIHFRYRFRCQLRHNLVVWVPDHQAEIGGKWGAWYDSIEEAKSLAENHETRLVEEFRREQEEEKPEPDAEPPLLEWEARSESYLENTYYTAKSALHDDGDPLEYRFIPVLKADKGHWYGAHDREIGLTSSYYDYDRLDDAKAAAEAHEHRLREELAGEKPAESEPEKRGDLDIDACRELVELIEARLACGLGHILLPYEASYWMRKCRAKGAD